jgi:Short C-terminal domain
MFRHKKLLTEGAQGLGIITEMTVEHARNAPDAVACFQVSFRFRFEDGSVGDSQFELTQWEWRHEFDANVFGWLENYLQPGEPVPVRYDPTDHSKLELDLPALKAALGPKIRERNAISDARLADKIARAEERMSGSAAAGSPPQSPGGGAPNEFAAPLDSGSIADILQQATADPDGFRARMVGETQGPGVSAFVVTDAGMAPFGGERARQPTDVADALGKLADLRDRGVLTPAEFEAQKQKLLGT